MKRVGQIIYVKDEGIEAYVPRVGYEKDEIFRYQDTDIKKLFAELWTKVKAQ